MFIGLSGYRNSQGQRTLAAALNILNGFVIFSDVVTGMGRPDGFEPVSGAGTLEVALVEGATGEVLWSNAVARRWENLDVEEMVQSVLKPFAK